LLVWQLQGCLPSACYTQVAQMKAAEDRSQPLRMKLEAHYAGPLQDTTIERWSDPVDGTICYIYMPIAVPHTPGPEGMVQYGSVSVGSISCFAGHPPTRASGDKPD
jgi:hypothetical protein